MTMTAMVIDAVMVNATHVVLCVGVGGGGRVPTICIA
jgi:hypothetical protein